MTKAAWTLIALLLLGHLALDVAVPVAMHRIGPFDNENAWVMYLLLGLCVGQVNLIAIWAALAPGRLLLRVLWSIFLAGLMWYALVLGNRIAYEIPYVGSGPFNWFRREVALHLGLLLLAGVLIAQVPLWVAARYRWRLRPPRLSKTPDDRQFNIAHLMVAMALVSVALGLGRFVLPEGQWRVAMMPGLFYVVMCVVAVVNLLVVVPAIWGAFARRSRIGPLIVGWLVFVVVVTFAEIGVITLIEGTSPPAIVWIGFPLFNLAQCACVFGTLLGLRLIGFTLRRLPSVAKGIPPVPNGDA